MEWVGVASLLVAAISLLVLVRQELRHKRIAGTYWGVEPIGRVAVGGKTHDVIDLTLYGSHGAHLFSIAQVGFKMELNALPDTTMKTGWTANSTVRIPITVDSERPWLLLYWRPHHRTDMFVFSWLPLNIRDFDSADGAFRHAWSERLPLITHRPKPVGPTGAMRLTLPARKQLQESEAETIHQIAIAQGHLRRWPPESQWQSKG